MIRFQQPVLDYEVPYAGVWYVEPKLRGVRLGAERTQEGWRWFTKRSTVTPPPHIAAALGWAPVGTFLDGEFVHGPSESTAWSVLGRRDPPAEGVGAVFDAVPGFPSGMPLRKRREVLRSVVKPVDGAITILASEEADSDPDAVRDYMAHLWEVNKQHGIYEGVVTKLASSAYRQGGKTRTWRKFKWKRE